MSTQPQIVVVDDDQGVRRSLQLFLRGHGYRVRSYADARSLLTDPDARCAALLVADYRMPGSDGFEICRALRDTGWNGAAVLITGFGDSEIRASAQSDGFVAVLDKPVRPSLLLRVARDAVTRADDS